MEKTIIEKLRDAKVSNEPAYVSFFNTGEVREDPRIAEKNMDNYSLDDTIRTLSYTYCDAAESYARNKYPYDIITMDLQLGLVFNRDDVDSENHLKENAEPLKGIVRYYTGDINSYLNGEKTNKHNYVYGKHGFAKYDQLVTGFKRNGIAFHGPETFDAFKTAILAGEKFNISLAADLEDQPVIEEEPKENVVEEQPEVPTTPTTPDKPRKLAKIPFFRKRKK